MQFPFAKYKSIMNIHVITMMVMFLFIIFFISIIFNYEYKEFDINIKKMQEQYIQKKKKEIVFDTQRVVKFIEYMYLKYHTNKNKLALQQEILNAIEHLYERQDGTGYIFIYDFKGTVLSDPVQRKNIGKNLYTIKDINGVKVIENLIRVSRQKNGGFVEYTWIKPTTDKLSPKASYAQSFEPWEWMVGTGVYLDEVEKSIVKKKSLLKEKLNKYMIDIVFLLLLLFIVGFIGILISNSILKNEIDIFTHFFQNAASKNLLIDSKKIRLIEFKNMVTYINIMIREIHARKQKLSELNATLEDKVKEKTKDLYNQNKLLLEEKDFSTSLVKAQDSFIKHSIHEINTPLAVILTHIDLFKIKHGSNRYLSKIEAGSKIINNIYDDLSYMVKKNRFIYKKTYFNFSVFLEKRVTFFEEIFQGNQQNIIVDIVDTIWIYMSEEKLQRLIDNNLSNATKYAYKGTTIKLSLKETKDAIILTFITHSPKIKDTKRIFKAFERENNVKGGFGLGLEIVYSIAQQEMIDIALHSSEKETSFIYTFTKGEYHEDTTIRR